MKKSALILSALVTVSSVTPIFAMETAQSTWSRFVTNGMLSLRDNVRSGLKHVAKLRNDIFGLKQSVDTMAGDNKQEGQNDSSVFDEAARGFREDLRQANIPEAATIVNDNNMSFIKMVMGGVLGYIGLRILLKAFFSQPQPQPANNRRNRFANMGPARGTPRGGRR